jgi:hypothetical protein
MAMRVLHHRRQARFNTNKLQSYMLFKPQFIKSICLLFRFIRLLSKATTDMFNAATGSVSAICGSSAANLVLDTLLTPTTQHHSIQA